MICSAFAANFPFLQSIINAVLRKKQIVDRDKKKIIGKRTKKIGVSGLDLNDK